MKKKEYITPNMRLLSCGMGSLLSGSGVSADGIGYGGVDNDGSKSNYIEVTAHGKWQTTPQPGFMMHEGHLFSSTLSIMASVVVVYGIS